jgi:hypothetical protein
VFHIKYEQNLYKFTKKNRPLRANQAQRQLYRLQNVVQGSSDVDMQLLTVKRPIIDNNHTK